VRRDEEMSDDVIVIFKDEEGSRHIMKGQGR
jgi:hypothetical protein